MANMVFRKSLGLDVLGETAMRNPGDIFLIFSGAGTCYDNGLILLSFTHLKHKGQGWKSIACFTEVPLL